jgi:hypothetical protein
MDNETFSKIGNDEVRAEPGAKPAQPTPASEYTRSMELAEELRLSLQKLRAGGSSKRNVRTASAPAAGFRPATPQPEAPAVAPPQINEASDVTLLRGTAPTKPAAPPSAREHDATIASAPKLTSSGNAVKTEIANSQKHGPDPNQT